ncbi:MAG: PDR/VanB family oxidoreductase [Stellaceae bacterium]
MEGDLRLRVASVTPLVERIKMFELEPVVGDLPPFEAGSHLEIRTGIGVARCYSIANDPRDRHRYTIAVLREREGLGSAWMHDAVTPGQVLEASPPRNGFALDETASEHLLLAGGIGITPLRAMAYRLQAIGARFRLIYCTRSPGTAAFGRDLVEAFGAAVTLHHDGGDPALSLDFRALLADRPAGAHLYVCGPRGMIDAARKAAAHWPIAAVHYEIFASSGATAPSAAADTAEDFAFEVELRRSGTVITVSAEETILDAMLAAGVTAPHVCKEGWCGNCQLPLLGGRADHRDEVLTDEEKAANRFIHVCVSRAAPGEKRLVIDR